MDYTVNKVSMEPLAKVFSVSIKAWPKQGCPLFFQQKATQSNLRARFFLITGARIPY